MKSISKNVYIDKLDDMVNKCKNTYEKIIKLKPNDVKTDTYIDFEVEHNDKDSKNKHFGVWWPFEDIKIQNNFWKRLNSKFVWRRFCD